MENKKRGGKRDGSGRPKNENKAFLIQCHPEKIKEVREYAKRISKTVPAEIYDLCLSLIDAECLKFKIKL